jgi:ABC-type lipoprotein release transport system permease subunit
LRSHDAKFHQPPPGVEGDEALAGQHHRRIGWRHRRRLAAGLGKLLSALLYRVSPLEPVVMTIAAVVLPTTAMLACYVPARRATRSLPLEALRSE